MQLLLWTQTVDRSNKSGNVLLRVLSLSMCSRGQKRSSAATVAAWVSEYSVQKTSAAALWANIADILYIGRILLIWYFGNITKFIGRFLVLIDNMDSCWKVTSKAALPLHTPFLKAWCATKRRCSLDQNFETKTWLKLWDSIKKSWYEDLKTCGLCWHFSTIFQKYLITTLKLKFLRISSFFPTCFCCFLPGDAADNKHG